MVVYTIGYAGRKIDNFITLLKDHDVSVLVDVRRFPKSKYPEYGREELQEILRRHGIKYVSMGDTLGGFRGGYERYMETKEYEEGIRRLVELARKGNVAIMCMERKTKGCHRRYISRTLEEMGIKVAYVE